MFKTVATGVIAATLAMTAITPALADGESWVKRGWITKQVETRDGETVNIRTWNVLQCHNGELKYYGKVKRSSHTIYGKISATVYGQQAVIAKGKKRYDMGSKGEYYMKTKVKSCSALKKDGWKLTKVLAQANHANYMHGHHEKVRVYSKSGKNWHLLKKQYKWNTANKSGARALYDKAVTEAAAIIKKAGGFAKSHSFNIWGDTR